MRAFLPLALIATPLMAASVLASAADLRSVAGMKDHSRVLLVFAPTMRDARLEEQRKAMARFSLGAAERDLVFVQVSEGKVLGAHDRDDKLRAKYKVPGPAYRTLLIGKDGSVSLTVDGPVDEHRLEAAIDAMPMRKFEVARAQAGKPLPKKN